MAKKWWKWSKVYTGFLLAFKLKMIRISTNFMKNDWRFTIYLVIYFCLLGLQHREVPRLGLNRSCSHQPTPQTQQCWIRAASAAYTTAQGNAGSLTHWVRPEIDSATSWFLVGFVNHWAKMGRLEFFRIQFKLSLSLPLSLAVWFLRYSWINFLPGLLLPVFLCPMLLKHWSFPPCSPLFCPQWMEASLARHVPESVAEASWLSHLLDKISFSDPMFLPDFDS